MESLKLSFEAVMPIFILMLVGYVVKKIKLVDKKCFDGINKLVFKIFLPVLLFYNIYSTKTIEVFNLKLIAFTIVGVFVIFFIGYFAVMFLTKENPKRGVMLQGFFRANYAILGLPLVRYICGDNAGGLSAMMVAVVIPVFNILAVVALERFKENSNKLDILKLIKGIFTNPLIIGCIAGIVAIVFKIDFPKIIEKSIKDISSVATPLSIIVLGSFFEFSDTKGCLKETIIVVLARLVIVPLIIIPFAVLFGFTGEALACVLIVFGAPVAVSSFAMSQQMGGDETLSVQVIAMSSVACLFTLFLWIFSLNFLGFF